LLLPTDSKEEPKRLTFILAQVACLAANSYEEPSFYHFLLDKPWQIILNLICSKEVGSNLSQALTPCLRKGRKRARQWRGRGPEIRIPGSATDQAASWPEGQAGVFCCNPRGTRIIIQSHALGIKRRAPGRVAHLDQPRNVVKRILPGRSPLKWNRQRNSLESETIRWTLFRRGSQDLPSGSPSRSSSF